MQETGKNKTAAVVLAAGSGKRMGTKEAKQYLLLRDKPVLYYALDAFEKSDVDDVILVTGQQDIERCREEIVERYGFTKVRRIVAGGRQRYDSVAEGLFALSESYGEEPGNIVLIHDGARPFLSRKLIEGLVAETRKYPACVTGTKVKDTIKVTDKEGFCLETPDRESLWAVQTPQAFSFPLILKAYQKLEENREKLIKEGVSVTDDACVCELFTDCRVKVIPGDYLNQKLTTPEDLLLAETILDAVLGS
ncbi:MAG: 2-C-methyl-D-erythritol 4-phosphate cytidylyltransferase [Lachnospiraceae bacterium]|nr:2-C-methyl-D-erythritol 4-phosphate cytidylyltransferase [Lachnospiraceae bacterium]